MTATDPQQSRLPPLNKDATNTKKGVPAMAFSKRATSGLLQRGWALGGESTATRVAL